MNYRNFKVIVSTGIHARVATHLVQAASKHACHLEISYNSKQANLKSIMGVMALAIPHNAVFQIIADGHEEDAVLDRMTEMLVDEGIATKLN